MGISHKDFDALLKNKDKPLLNHAVQAHYAPGSTYKLVTGTGGLAEREITPSTRLTTKPFLTLGGTKFYEWNRRGWGPCNIYCGFGHSSDTFFYQVAGMLGADRLGQWAHEYGFGAPTGIDLPGEVSGIVPTNHWKQEVLGAPMYGGETYQAGIGQGYDAVTPIQLINAYAALANGGTLYEPRIVREVVGPDGTVIQPFEPTVLREMDVKKSILRVMRNAARETVDAAPHVQPRRPADQDRRQVRHGRVRCPGRQGPPAVLLVLRRVHAQGPGQRLVQRHRLRARRDGLRA